MTSRLDLGNFQDLLKVLRNKVTDSKTNSLEGSIVNKILEDSPKFSNLAFLSDVRRVNQQEIRLGAKSINGLLNRFLDVFKLGWEVCPLAKLTSKREGLTSFLLPSWVETWFTINMRRN